MNIIHGFSAFISRSQQEQIEQGYYNKIYRVNLSRKLPIEFETLRLWNRKRDVFQKTGIKTKFCLPRKFFGFEINTEIREYSLT